MMKTHAWKSDGRTYCGLEGDSIIAVTPQTADGSFDPEIVAQVECRSCQRYVSVYAAPAAPAGAVDEELVRRIVQEELSALGGADRLLKRREVASMLSVGLKRVDKLVKKGKLKLVGVGKRKKRIRLSSVQAFIERLKS